MPISWKKTCHLQVLDHNPTTNKITFIPLRKKNFENLWYEKNILVKSFLLWLFFLIHKVKRIGMKFKKLFDPNNKEGETRAYWKVLSLPHLQICQFSQREPRLCKENKSPHHHVAGFRAGRLSWFSEAFLRFSCCSMLHVFKEFYISWLWRAAASSQSATKTVSVFRQGGT